MIKDWLSRYHPRYPRALAYMLQATEYDVRDYLAWYSQTADFIRVERRKEFVGSLKGKLILVSAWLILLCLYALAIGSLWLISEPISYVASRYQNSDSREFWENEYARDSRDSPFAR